MLQQNLSKIFSSESSGPPKKTITYYCPGFWNCGFQGPVFFNQFSMSLRFVDKFFSAADLVPVKVSRQSQSHQKTTEGFCYCLKVTSATKLFFAIK